MPKPTSCVILMITLLSFLAVCFCRPSSLLGEDSANYPQDQDLDMPVSMPCSPLLSALKAQAHNLLPSDYKTAEKKPAANTESLDELFPNIDGDFQMAGIKRRIFWQPLGYMPAAARAHNGPLAATGSGNQGVSSNVFRYG